LLTLHKSDIGEACSTHGTDDKGMKTVES